MKACCPILFLLHLSYYGLAFGELIQQQDNYPQPDPLQEDIDETVLKNSEYDRGARHPSDDAGDVVVESKQTDGDVLYPDIEHEINQERIWKDRDPTEIEEQTEEGSSSKLLEEEEENEKKEETEDKKDLNGREHQEQDRNSQPEAQKQIQAETEPVDFHALDSIHVGDEASSEESTPSGLRDETASSSSEKSEVSQSEAFEEKILELGQTLGVEQTVNKTEQVEQTDSNASVENLTLTSEQTSEQITDESYRQPVCGVWGSLSKSPRADYKVLYLLFRNVELGEAPPRQEIPSAADMAGKITDDAFQQAKRVRTDPDHNETRSKSANSEFVEGLDDIGKFFEDVEPPDELDVGAMGLSIQDVLMGQGTRIVLKRLQMGFNFVRKSFITAKNIITETLMDEDGNLTEAIEGAARWMWKSSKRVYIGAQTILDNLIERGISGFLSRDEDDYDSSSTPEVNVDVRALLRNYSRGG